MHSPNNCLEYVSHKVHEPGKSGNPGKLAIFTKSQGKPVIVRELFIFFIIQVRATSGKRKYLVYISFSLAIGLVFR